jgi:hypothetical protein
MRAIRSIGGRNVRRLQKSLFSSCFKPGLIGAVSANVGLDAREAAHRAHRAGAVHSSPTVTEARTAPGFATYPLNFKRLGCVMIPFDMLTTKS